MYFLIRFLFVILLLPCLLFGQDKTYVSDNNFEAYLESNGIGDGILDNDSVLTSAIDTVVSLDVQSNNIYDLTGIEDFTALRDLNCERNSIKAIIVDKFSEGFKEIKIN